MRKVNLQCMKKLQFYSKIYMKKIIAHFLDLVSIDSPSGYEMKVSEYIQAWLKKNNFECKTDSVGNLYADNNGSGTPLLLSAHMDTVQPGKNIHPIIEDDIIKSDGKTILGADNKVSIAAILAAIEKNNNKHLELLFTVKEETGGGVEYFPFKWIKSKNALVFDSSKPIGGIILSSPFISNIDIKFIGKSAHASSPENGINAFTPTFQALSTLTVGSLDNGETTINFGLIEGGTGINTIPNAIHIQGEVRSYSKILFFKHIEKIEKTIQMCAKKYHVGSEFELNGSCAGYVHKKNDLFILSLSNILSQLGLVTTFHTRSGISDANILNAAGIKTYNLTNGVKNAHTTKEQITVSDLTMLGKLVEKCIAKL